MVANVSNMIRPVKVTECEIAVAPGPIRETAMLVSGDAGTTIDIPRGSPASSTVTTAAMHAPIRRGPLAMRSCSTVSGEGWR